MIDFVITGTMVHYAATCDTKTWLHLRGIQPERNNEHVRAGSINDRSVSQNIYMDGIVIDEIDWDNKTVIEHKLGFIGEGSKAQLAHYLSGFNEEWTAVIKSRKKQQQLDAVDLEPLYSKIKTLLSTTKMPIVKEKLMCEKCAFNEFCYS